MSEQKVNSVFPKILKLRKEVTYLQKNTKSYNYKYVNGSSVLGVVKPIMNDLDLEIFPSVSNTRHMHVHYTKPKTVTATEDGKKVQKVIDEIVSEHVVLADITYTWVDAETGDQYSHTLFGAGSDPDPSKAQGKMLTYMERYHLLKTLNIATDEDDPDAYLKKYQDIAEKREETERMKRLQFIGEMYKSNPVWKLCLDNQQEEDGSAREWTLDKLDKFIDITTKTASRADELGEKHYGESASEILQGTTEEEPQVHG